MERFGNIMIAVSACIVGLVLFLLGYSTVRYYNSNGKWLKKFWISVAIVLVFLATTFYGCKSTILKHQKIQEQNKTDSFTEIQKIWNEISIFQGWEKRDITLYKEMSEAINKLQQERKFSDAIKLTLNLLLTERTQYYDHKKFGATCYYITPQYSYIKTLEDLENQYVLLEKMNRDGNINLETFSKVKDTIKKNYKSVIDWLSNRPLLEGLSAEEENKLIDIIIELIGIKSI